MERDDLFTNIHKGLRRGLFDLTVAVGATDWSDPESVHALELRWRPLDGLLRAHTRHEDDHIFCVLEAHDPAVAATVTEQHRDLDDLLDDLAARFDRLCSRPDPALGLDLYRDVARFVAAYLTHLHEEETVVMARIWAHCSDEAIASTRAAFMAEVTPDEQALSMRLMLPALDPATRDAVLTAVSRSPNPAASRALELVAPTTTERAAPHTLAGGADGTGVERGSHTGNHR